jgi:transcriptional regulator with XRE-family HTH domain
MRVQKTSRSPGIRELKAEYVSWRKAVGYVIARCRDEKGLTQEQMGKKIGRSRDWVAKAEIGKRKVEFGDLVVIARKLEISLKVMLHRALTWNGESADLHL